MLQRSIRLGKTPRQFPYPESGNFSGSDGKQANWWRRLADLESRSEFMNAITEQIIRGNNQNSNLSDTPPVHTSDDAKTILVVDDQPAVCDVAATILNHFGYHARTATSGEQAKSIAQESPGIDLLLTDIEMPGMRGDELPEWLPTTCPETPVVFISKTPVASHLGNSCHFVDNPFIHLDQFLKAIREALDHRCGDTADFSHAA
jgi:CheY-like chemotaxis protein